MDHPEQFVKRGLNGAYEITSSNATLKENSIENGCSAVWTKDVSSSDVNYDNDREIRNKSISEIETNNKSLICGMDSLKKVGPLVPPKPYKKKQDYSEVSTDIITEQVCEPHYSKQLHGTTNVLHKSSQSTTLDNPLVLDQQLAALAHHKRQLEKKGIALKQPKQRNDEQLSDVLHSPKSSPCSLESEDSPYNIILKNGHIPSTHVGTKAMHANITELPRVGGNIINTKSSKYIEQNADIKLSRNQADNEMAQAESKIHSKFICKENKNGGVVEPPPSEFSIDAIEGTLEYSGRHAEETLPPSSPVSSSYSELRRATNVFKKMYIKNQEPKVNCNELNTHDFNGPYTNVACSNDFTSYCTTMQTDRKNINDIYNNGSSTQGSTTYESIYEPIIPRPASRLSSNNLNYGQYVNGPQLMASACTGNSSTIGAISSSACSTPSYPSPRKNASQNKEIEVNALTDYLVQSLDTGAGVENYGTCFKCNGRVIGENSGCTAMEQIFHITCFTCAQCKVNLQGKPFYALDGKPFCEYDYLQTLEKCSVCMKPIMERILRATGKPYHPQCFTCKVCGNNLDGIPFTVDATNQNYCIADFHKIFAPRCCVCMEPIMPKPGEEETVRVVALDRSFHFECYKCEDCGLLLSSEAEGRGCYPLDGHVLCKSCNAKRVQMLTQRISTEL